MSGRPEADVADVRPLPEAKASLPTQAHDLLCTASLSRQKTLFSPTRGTGIVSQDLDQDFGKGVKARLSSPQRDQRRLADRTLLPEYGGLLTRLIIPAFTEEGLLYRLRGSPSSEIKLNNQTASMISHAAPKKIATLNKIARTINGKISMNDAFTSPHVTGARIAGQKKEAISISRLAVALLSFSSARNA